MAFLFWVSAIFTKGIAALLTIPGIFIYLLIKQKIFIFSQKYFWLLILFSFLAVGGYLFGRELMNPGYLVNLWKFELLGRYQTDLGSGDNNFWYYLNLFASFRFQKWIYLLPFSVLAVFLTKDKTIKNFILFIYLSIISCLLFISLSATKQFWYDAPLYPLMSIIIAIFIVLLISKMPIILKIFSFFVLAFYLQRFIRTNLAYIQRPDLDKSISCLKYGYLFRDNSINKTGFIGVHQDISCSPFQFYFEANNLSTKNPTSLIPGDKVITCDIPTLKQIQQLYQTHQLFKSQDECYGINILHYVK